MRHQLVFSVLAAVLLAVAVPRGLHAQHSHAPSDTTRASAQMQAASPLQAPGHSIFGTVQEVIRELESRPNTDWSSVDVERLRRHLLDMHRVAQKVTVANTEPVENGVRITVRPQTDVARASLKRVLSAHPAMLKAEAGWSMTTRTTEDGFVLTTTDPDGEEADKIRALGYIGLLSYGAHHQKHHWMIVRGEHPHHGASGSGP